MRVRISIVAFAMLAFASLTTGAHATGNAALCQLVGTVHLSTPTDIQNATQSSGQFTTAGTSLICSGAVVGAAALSGTGDTFHFCVRNPTFSSTNPACHNQKADTLGLNPAYDVLDAAHKGLVAYFVGGPISLTGFEVGGPCTFSFDGYAVAANATININSFNCLRLPNMTGFASASSIPLATTPCNNNSLCFQDVVFLGTIEVHD